MRALGLTVAIALLLPASALASHDHGRPHLSITQPAANETVHGVVHIEGTASDTDGAVSRVEVRIDNSGGWQTAEGTTDWSFAWNANNAGDGNHLIEARAVDDQGQYSRVETRTVALDNTQPNDPPTVAFTAPAPGTTVNGTITVNGTASDPDGWVTEVKVRPAGGFFQLANGKESWTFELDTTLLDNGPVTLEARAFDGEDHSPLATLELTIANEGGATGQGDNEAPRVAVQTPKTGDIVEGVVTVQGVADDTDGSVFYVQVSIDNGPWRDADGIAHWTYSWDTRSLNDGEHTLEARSFDGKAHSAIDRVTVNVDNAQASNGNRAPEVVITAPADQDEIAGTVRIEGLAEDANGVETITKVEVRVVGVLDWQEASGTRAWRFSWDTTGTDPGPLTIEVRAHDGQAFSETASVRVHLTGEAPEPEVVVDPVFGNEPPEVFVDLPQEDQVMPRPLGVQGVANDPDPDDRQLLLELKLDDGAWQRFDINTGRAFVAQPDADELGPGAHVLSVRVFDGKAYSAIVNRTFQFDNGTLEPADPNAAPGAGVAWAALALVSACLVAARRRTQR